MNCERETWVAPYNPPIPKTTLAEHLWPLMECPTIREDRCLVCKRREPLNQHHIVRRGSGQLVRGGLILPKPSITLCGFGNHMADGRRHFCHGLAHHHMLHFKYDPEEAILYALKVGRPIRYTEALKLDGWVPIWTER